MALEKWAVDEAAKSYWSSYYKEYGKTWVREIPRKIKAAMVENKKTANAEGAEGIVSPVGTAWDKEAVYLEGMFTPKAGGALMFTAKFDHDGNLKAFDTLQLVKEASKPDFLKSKSKSKSTSKPPSTSKSKSKSKSK